MDWGLLDKSAGENILLREEIVYSSKVRKATSVYYGKKTKKKKQGETEK